VHATDASLEIETGSVAPEARYDPGGPNERDPTMKRKPSRPSAQSSNRSSIRVALDHDKFSVPTVVDPQPVVIETG
jgi:hypothetical protein